MKNLFLAGLLLWAYVQVAFAQQAQTYEVKPAYFLGMAASYIDSTVYFTDIQSLPEVAMDLYTKQPLNIEMYTQQLSQYFKNSEASTFVCMTYAAEKRKDIEKLYLKLKKKYGKNPGFTIKELAAGSWSYEVVDPSSVYRYIIDETVSDYVPDTGDLPESRDGNRPPQDGDGPPQGGERPERPN